MFLFFDKSAFGEAFADEGFGVFDFKQQVGFVRFDADEVFVAHVTGGKLHPNESICDDYCRFPFKGKRAIKKIILGNISPV